MIEGLVFGDNPDNDWTEISRDEQEWLQGAKKSPDVTCLGNIDGYIYWVKDDTIWRKK